MATYLVGEQKSTLFSSNKNWNLEDAIEAAQDGDTIEIERGFSGDYENEITVDKSIKIQGHFQQNSDGTKTFSTVLNCRFFITNGAHVTLQDLWISQAADKTNCISVRNASYLVIINLQLVNTAEKGENYPIVYVDGDSTLDMSQTYVQDSKIHDENHKIYLENSTVNISNSTINANIKIKKSKFAANEIEVNNTDSNAITSLESSVTLRNCTLSGGKTNGKTTFPCFIVRESRIEGENIRINQPNVDCSLDAYDSTLHIKQARISSVELIGSEVEFSNMVVTDSLSVENKSNLKADIIDILGHVNGTINLYVNKNSAINADAINFGKTTSPNIKAERNTQISVKDFNIVQYDENTGELVKDKNNRLTLIRKSDIDYFGKDTSAGKELNDLIGISSVKSKMAEFVAVAEMNKKREAKGLTKSTSTLHSLYLGNPGTGKTTVARIAARLLFEKHVINSDKLVEVSRSDLVANYTGQTATKTRKVLESALGGVLFIDEAYTLSNGDSDNFGLEAIDEILKFMEDHRSDIVLIFAGYTKEMQKFLDTNSGLKSRIPNVFNFEDYSPEELVQIGLFQLTQQKYTVDHAAYSNLVKHNFELSNDHSNGRWVRNLNEQILRKIAIRFSKDENIDLSQITNEDLNAVEL